MFNDRLRSARIFRGYTLQKTADALGLSLRAIQKYEGGEREPNLSLLVEMADFLMSLRIFFSVEMFTCVLSEYPLMYPQKVLQGVPNLKRALKICIFNFLIMSQSDS